MTQQGTVTEWNDERGFGFIQPTLEGGRVFFHVSSFQGRGRPRAGLPVTFTRTQNTQGRDRAAAVRPAHVTRRWSWPVPLALGFLGLLLVLTMTGVTSVIALVYHAIFSLAAYVSYRQDKAAAQAGYRRTSERTLLTVALIGGWPGALLAMQQSRHKLAKRAFMVPFLGSVTLHLLVFTALAALG